MTPYNCKLLVICVEFGNCYQQSTLSQTIPYHLTIHSAVLPVRPSLACFQNEPFHLSPIYNSLYVQND
jgi:hypothetical protein